MAKWFERLKCLIPYAMIILFIVVITPETFWNKEAASGGDTGSHYYALWVLFYQSLPLGKISSWNPGALFGEFQLLHYFPAPFLLMSLIGLVMPLGLAFNLGTIGGLFFLPMVVHFAFEQKSKSKWTSWMATVGSLVFIFNESYSMWGGNSLSTLAGQFAHLYALVFAFLYLGLAWRQLEPIRNISKPRLYLETLFAGFILGLVGLSHSYVFLLMPFLMLGIWSEFSFSKRSFLYLLKTGVVSLMTCSWFIIDQVKHAPWMTANPMTWYYENFWKEVLPKLFWPVLILGTMSIAVLWLYRKNKLKNQIQRLPFLSFFVALIGCAFMYVIFPKFGLVNARIWPQVHLLVLSLLAGAFGMILESFKSRANQSTMRMILIVISGLAGIWIVNIQYHYPYWIDWNYSSWKSKKNWNQAQQVFDFLKTDFSHPRATYEHHPSLNDFGSTRVFELLPLFSQRATLESLYQEAMFTAPLTYWVQASVSTNPSCPIRGWNCPTMNFAELKNKLSLLGVKYIILKSSGPKSAIRKTPGYQLAFSNDYFEVWEFSKDISLVEVLRDNPKNPMLVRISDWDFRKDFYPWFEEYEPGSSFLIAAPENADISLANESEICHESVSVSFNLIQLSTNCPGKVHLLKFTYHPKLKATDGSPIYAISPGFMAIVPKSSLTTIQPASW